MKILAHSPEITLCMRPIPFDLKHKGFMRFIEWRLTQRLWVITEDFIFWSAYLHCWVKIPKGFVFDGASIPKMLQFVINPTDAVLFGAVIHDFIYRFQQMIICTDEDYGRWALGDNLKRRQADELIKEISLQYDNVEYAAYICYYVLLPFGEFAWKRARKRNFKLTTAYPEPTNKYLQKGLTVPV